MRWPSAFASAATRCRSWSRGAISWATPRPSRSTPMVCVRAPTPAPMARRKAGDYVRVAVGCLQGLVLRRQGLIRTARLLAYATAGVLTRKELGRAAAGGRGGLGIGEAHFPPGAF